MQFGLADAVNATVYATDGRVTLEAKSVRSLDISQLVPGVYFVRLADRDGQAIGVARLVKDE